MQRFLLSAAANCPSPFVAQNSLQSKVDITYPTHIAPTAKLSLGSGPLPVLLALGKEPFSRRRGSEKERVIVLGAYASEPLKEFSVPAHGFDVPAALSGY